MTLPLLPRVQIHPNRNRSLLLLSFLLLPLFREIRLRVSYHANAPWKREGDSVSEQVDMSWLPLPSSFFYFVAFVPFSTPQIGEHTKRKNQRAPVLPIFSNFNSFAFCVHDPASPFFRRLGGVTFSPVSKSTLGLANLGGRGAKSCVPDAFFDFSIFTVVGSSAVCEICSILQRERF